MICTILCYIGPRYNDTRFYVIKRCFTYSSSSHWLHSETQVWGHISGSTLGNVIPCCLTAPSHYLNQCWISLMGFYDIHLRAVLHRVPKLLFCVPANYTFKITSTTPMGQWVKNPRKTSLVVQRDPQQSVRFLIHPCRVPSRLLNVLIGDPTIRDQICGMYGLSISQCDGVCGGSDCWHLTGLSQDDVRFTHWHLCPCRHKRLRNEISGCKDLLKFERDC